LEDVLELSPATWSELEDALSDVRAFKAMNAAQAKKKKQGKKGKKAGNKKKTKRSKGLSTATALIEELLPLTCNGMFLAVNMENAAVGSDACKVVFQLMQCLEACIDDLIEEEEDVDLAIVLVGWGNDVIQGPSILSGEVGEMKTIRVTDIEQGGGSREDGLSEDEERPWVFSCDVDEDCDYNNLLEFFAIFDDEPLVLLDSTDWVNFKSIVESIKDQTGKGKYLPKHHNDSASARKALEEQLTELCAEGMLLVITNSKTGDYHSDVICQALQLMEEVFEGLDDEMGTVLCVLPGWGSESHIEGPSLDNPSEKMKIKVMPDVEFPAMIGMDVDEDELRQMLEQAKR